MSSPPVQLSTPPLSARKAPPFWLVADAVCRRVAAWWRGRIVSVLCLLLVASLGGAYFHELGHGDLKDWDEALYATRALAIYAHGGETWLDQTPYAWLGYYSGAFPPLLVWSSAAMFKLTGGPSEFAHRFFTALVSASGLIALFLCGWRLRGKGAGLMAALIQFSVLFYTQYSRRGQFDVWFITFGLWALFFYIQAQFAARTGATRRNWLLACGAALGLSLMSKILVGGVIFVGVVAPFAIWSIATGRKTWREFVAEVGLVFLPAFVVWAPWHLYMTWRGGVEFWDWYINFHILKRGTQTLDFHNQPVWFYASMLIESVPAPLLAAMCCGVVAGAVEAARGLRRGRRVAAGSAATAAPGIDWSASYVLAAWAFLMPMILYTASPTRRDTYCLPMVPPLALLGSLFVFDFAAGRFGPKTRGVVLFFVALAAIVERSPGAMEEVLFLWNDPQNEFLSPFGRDLLRANLGPIALGAAAIPLFALLVAATIRAASGGLATFAAAWRWSAGALVVGVVVVFAARGDIKAFDAERGRRAWGWQEILPYTLERGAYDEILFLSGYTGPAMTFYLYGSGWYPIDPAKPCRHAAAFEDAARWIAESKNPMIVVDWDTWRSWPEESARALLQPLHLVKQANHLGVFAKPESGFAERWREHWSVRESVRSSRRPPTPAAKQGA